MLYKTAGYVTCRQFEVQQVFVTVHCQKGNKCRREQPLTNMYAKYNVLILQTPIMAIVRHV